MLGKTSTHFSSMLPTTTAIGCKSWFTMHSSKVSSSFRFKVSARKAENYIKLDRIFQPIPPLKLRSIEASFLSSKHVYKISTQPNLLTVVNSQIISNQQIFVCSQNNLQQLGAVCSPPPSLNAERQAGKVWIPYFRVFWYDSTRGLNPMSTDCEANALTITPSIRTQLCKFSAL